MVSKALVIGAYRGKLAELAKLGLEIVAVVPPEWREGGRCYRLEPEADSGYELLVSPMRWNGHFHFHFYPQLPGIIRHTRPDIVHVDEEPYNLATFLGISAAARNSLPSLFFSWQNLVRRYPPPFAQIERSVYRRARHALGATAAFCSVRGEKATGKGFRVFPSLGFNPDFAHPDLRPHDASLLAFSIVSSPQRRRFSVWMPWRCFLPIRASAWLEMGRSDRTWSRRPSAVVSGSESAFAAGSLPPRSRISWAASASPSFLRSPRPGGRSSLGGY